VIHNSAVKSADQSIPEQVEPGGANLTRRQLLVAAGGVGLGVVLAGCNDDGPQAGRPPGPTVEPNGVVVDVQSIDNTFRPDRIEITPGTEVVWTNLGRTEHDVLAVDGTWGVQPEDFPPGASFSHVFGEVAEVPYYCSIHAVVGDVMFGMTGTIVVVEA